MASRRKDPAAPLVLVAEDEPAMLNLVTSHLRGRGFDVVEASDGDEALDLVQKHRPALVVLDVMMPGMSGWEVCKRVKADRENLSGTGVIMLTGIGESLNDMTSPLFAADAWLDKPFALDQLDAKIDEVQAKLGVRVISAAPEKRAVKRATGKAPAAKAPAQAQPAVKVIAKKPAAKSALTKSSSMKKPEAKKPAEKKLPVAKIAATTAKKPAASAGGKSAAKKSASKKA
jgi:CheY-like chemotaxis protein